jgi:haloalkane dehalogenase
MASPPETDISPEFNFELQYVAVLGSRMAYVDTKDTHGSSTTAVLLHGNPTSSYLYRNIIPHISPEVRCIAPDLIGCGKSDKPDIAYRIVDHIRYLDAFLDTVVPEGKIVFVIQDWGSALGLHWSRRHEGRVAAICLMEFIRPFTSWEEMGENPAGKWFLVPKH